jgi:hypothetical protein
VLANLRTPTLFAKYFLLSVWAHRRIVTVRAIRSPLLMNACWSTFAFFTISFHPRMFANISAAKLYTWNQHFWNDTRYFLSLTLTTIILPLLMVTESWPSAQSATILTLAVLTEPRTAAFLEHAELIKIFKKDW